MSEDETKGRAGLSVQGWETDFLRLWMAPSGQQVITIIAVRISIGLIIISVTSNSIAISTSFAEGGFAVGGHRERPWSSCSFTGSFATLTPCFHPSMLASGLTPATAGAIVRKEILMALRYSS